MRWRLPLILLASAWMLACDSGPTPGDLTVSLETPGLNDGAILFQVEAAPGEAITGITALCDGCKVFTYSESDASVYAAVTGRLSSGPLVTVSVTDVGAAELLTFTVLQTAGLDRSTRPTTGYLLFVDNGK